MKHAGHVVACLCALALGAASAYAQGGGGAMAPGADWDMAAGVGGSVQAGAGAPPAPTFSVLDPTIPIPSNGSILLQAGNDEAPVIEVIAHESGTSIAGSIRHVTLSYWAWKADAPLAPGGYSVDVLGDFGTTASITVIEAMAIEPPPIASAPELSVAYTVVSLHSCRRWTGTELIEDASFAATEIGQPYVKPRLYSTAPPALVHQFLYALSMVDSGLRYHFPFSAAVQAGPYATQADEYCVRFEAMDLTMSAIHPYAELTPLCVPHGSLPDLAERNAEVSDSMLDRFVCHDPPPGLADRWCTVNRSCADLAPASRTIGNGCVLYGHTCLGEDLPDPPPPIVGGMTGGSAPPDVDPSTGGTQSTTMTMTTDPEDAMDRPRLVTSGCGCFIGAHRGGATTGAPWLFAFGMFLVVQRALRRR